MFKSAVFLVPALLLCAPTFAQAPEKPVIDEGMVSQLDRGLPIRGLLSSLFAMAKVPFVIGPGIEGQVSLSTESQKLPLEKTVSLVISTLPYAAEYVIDNGIHIVRRRPDGPAIAPSGAAHTVNVGQPTISVAPPKITLNPTTVFSYRDALLWELTRTEIEKARLLSLSSAIPRDEVKAADLSMQLLQKRLTELETSTRPAFVPPAIPPISTNVSSLREAIQKELFRAEVASIRLESKFGPNYPDVVESQVLVARLKSRLVELNRKQPRKSGATRTIAKASLSRP
jgi:hypothetical protein